MFFFVKIVLVFVVVISNAVSIDDTKFLRKSSIVWPGLNFAGNGDQKIEDISISNIELLPISPLPNVTEKWKHFEYSGNHYLFSSNNVAIFLYQFDIKEYRFYEVARFSPFPDQVSSFKILKFSSNDVSQQSSIYLLVSLTNSNTLSWYYLNRNSFVHFWTWMIEGQVRSIEYLRVDKDEHRILLLQEGRFYFQEAYSYLYIYEFNLGESRGYRLCKKALIPQVRGNIITCPTSLDHIFAVEGSNIVFFYSLGITSLENCSIKEISRLSVYEPRNAFCFSSGYHIFLGASGNPGTFYYLEDHQFQPSEKTNDILKEIGEAIWIENLPVDTYRDESLLIVQSADRILRVFSWRGNFFHKIGDLTGLRNAHLSSATIIPNFGFIFGTTFVKISVEIKSLHDQLESVLSDQLRLQNLLDDQEDIIAKTKELTSGNNGDFYEFLEVLSDEVNIGVMNDFDVFSGNSEKISIKDLETRFRETVLLLSDLQSKINQIRTAYTVLSENLTGTMDLTELDVSEWFSVGGNLEVKNLVIDHLNGIPLESSSVFTEDKYFPEVEFSTNVTVKNINGVPMKDISLNPVNAKNIDYENFDFSAIKKVVFSKNLDFTTIAGVNWKDLLDKVVFKDRDSFVPGTTVISGEMVAKTLYVDLLNDLKYPSEYVLKTHDAESTIHGFKNFQSLKVASIDILKSINNVPVDDFIFLDSDQYIDKLISFENLTVDLAFVLDGDIVGSSSGKIDPNLNLMNSKSIYSNVIVNKLRVSGSIYVNNSINGTNWQNFSDLLTVPINDDQPIDISGKLIFLNDTNFPSGLEIRSSLINDQPMENYVTTDTEQVFPYLQKLSGNFTFGEVKYDELIQLEEFFNQEQPRCIQKMLAFNKPPLVDEIVANRINDDISGFEFAEKLRTALSSLNFQSLLIDTLMVEDLVPEFINEVSLWEFQYKRLMKGMDQVLTGNVTFENLRIDSLKVNHINDLSFKELQESSERISQFYDELYKNGRVNSLRVKNGNFGVSRLNGSTLGEILGISHVKSFIYRWDDVIEHLTIDGTLNGVNFRERLQDLVLKSDSPIEVFGEKRAKSLNAKSLVIDRINDHEVTDLLDAEKIQSVEGTVRVKGSVLVDDFFDSNGYADNFLFKDIRDMMLRSNSWYRLRGNYTFNETVALDLENLEIQGRIQEVDYQKFTNNLVQLNDDRQSIEVEGFKYFENQVDLKNDATINKNLDELNLSNFYEKVVLIDGLLMNVTNSKVIFESDVMLKANLNILGTLKVGSIKGIDVEDLYQKAIYTDRDENFSEPIVVNNVVFESDAKVEVLNDLEMKKLFTLKTQQWINSSLKIDNVWVDEFKLHGLLNNRDLKEVLNTTFMLFGDQNISASLRFRDEVIVRQNFYADLINGVNMTKVVTLSDPGVITGDFIFEDSIYLAQNLILHGSLNNLNLTHWHSEAFLVDSPTKQTVTGNWRINGSVHFAKNITGTAVINGVDVKELSLDLKNQRNNHLTMASDKMKNLRNICTDLRLLETEVKNSIYKFEHFDYLQLIRFEQKIASVHHVEHDSADYFMVNLASGDLDIMVFVNGTFDLVRSLTSFGIVNRWITLIFQKELYVLTLGRPNCLRNAGNLWKFDSQQLWHVYDFGNLTDAENFGDETFGTYDGLEFRQWSLETISKSFFEPLATVRVNRKNAKIFKTGQKIMLVTSKIISELGADFSLAEWKNPFESNSIFRFEAGIYRREYFVVHDDSLNKEFALLFTNGWSGRKLVQIIRAQKSHSFLTLNFEDFIENLLIFAENKKRIQIFNYNGIEGFKFHSTLKMKVDKLINFKLTNRPNLAKKQCLAVVHDNQLTILEAKMRGEKLDKVENFENTC